MTFKPKLAEGSRWSKDTPTAIIDRFEDRIYADNEWITRKPKNNVRSAFKTTDALAAIRAAKLDPVFDSAVALRELYRGGRVLSLADLHPAIEAIFAAVEQSLEPIDANSAAVKGATDAV